MPKMKSHRGARKRFKVTGTGKILRRSQGKGHLLSHKSSKRRRNMRKDTAINDSQLRTVRILMQS
jgi:large subunit ribosomal protein L35